MQLYIVLKMEKKCNKFASFSTISLNFLNDVFSMYLEQVNAIYAFH